MEAAGTGSFDVVVCHYGSRDFGLLPPLLPEARFVVYDKSGSYPGECVRVPNRGREGSVYLAHIIGNYDRLAERTLFIQDDLLNHRTDLLSFVAEVISDRSDFHQFPCTWNRGESPYRRTIVDGSCDLHTLKSPLAIREACRELHIDLPQEYTTESCAFFSVRRTRVLARGRDFYSRVREWVLAEEANEFALEHMWALIF